MALLATTGAFRSTELRRAIEKTFEDRGTHLIPQSRPEPPADFWANGYLRLARLNRLPWARIDYLMTAVRGFIDPVLAGNGGTWNTERWRWE